MNCPICNQAMTPIWDPELKKWFYECPECGVEEPQEPQP